MCASRSYKLLIHKPHETKTVEALNLRLKWETNNFHQIASTYCSAINGPYCTIPYRGTPYDDVMRALATSISPVPRGILQLHVVTS